MSIVLESSSEILSLQLFLQVALQSVRMTSLRPHQLTLKLFLVAEKHAFSTWVGLH